MPGTRLIFDTLPLSFLSLTMKLFHDSRPVVAMLPLHSMEQPAPAITQSWLHRDERTQLENFGFKKRYREWLGGRICAKHGLRLFLNSNGKPSEFTPEHAQCCVQSEESGRPYFSRISGVDFSFPELSISHSNDYAAAMISASFCGIDIQFSAPSLIRVQDRFCSPEENRLLGRELSPGPELSRLTLLWSAKEAVKKMLSPGGIPGFQELHLCKIEQQQQNNDHIFFFSTTESSSLIPVAVTMMENNYAAAICCTTTTQPGIA